MPNAPCRCFSRSNTTSPRTWIEHLSYQAYDAGHILGSAALVLDYRGNGARVRLGFSGDVGRPNLPITRPPDALPPVEYLILESTYGGKFHKSATHVIDKLRDVVSVLARGADGSLFRRSR